MGDAQLELGRWLRVRRVHLNCKLVRFQRSIKNFLFIILHLLAVLIVTSVVLDGHARISEVHVKLRRLGALLKLVLTIREDGLHEFKNLLSHFDVLYDRLKLPLFLETDCGLVLQVTQDLELAEMLLVLGATELFNTRAHEKSAQNVAPAQAAGRPDRVCVLLVLFSRLQEADLLSFLLVSAYMIQVRHVVVDE